MNKVDFCNCKDIKCPFHPSNHTHGCTLCIKKCLKQGEIPSCFFNAVANEFPQNMQYTYEGFADLVQAQKKK